MCIRDRFAYQIILARMESELNSPKHSRETAVEFRQDWFRGEDSRARRQIFAAAQMPANVSSSASPPVLPVVGSAEAQPVLVLGIAPKTVPELFPSHLSLIHIFS